MARGIELAFALSSCYRVAKEPPGLAMIRCSWCGASFTKQRVGNAFHFWGKLKAIGVAHTKVCPKRPIENTEQPENPNE
jgi:hypothetical protein